MWGIALEGWRPLRRCAVGMAPDRLWGESAGDSCETRNARDLRAGWSARGRVPWTSGQERPLSALRIGRNILNLSILCLARGRTATDQDQLVFIVK